MERDGGTDGVIPGAETGINSPSPSSTPEDPSHAEEGMIDWIVEPVIAPRTEKLPTTEPGRSGSPGGGVARAEIAGGAARAEIAEIARDNLDRLYGFCLRMTGNPSDAEDLLQETLLRGMRAWPDVRDPARARPWLFTIATNAWRDTARARSRKKARSL